MSARKILPHPTRYKYLACDFETTVSEDTDNQLKTEVWASAVVELYTEDVKIFHSIDDTWNYFISFNKNLICYYHNLKFDGSFWLYFLLVKLHFKQAYDAHPEPVGAEAYIGSRLSWQPKYRMENNSFAYHISSNGLWYYITIKYNDKIIELRDSYKLIPFSIKRIGKDFETKHRKKEMEYVGERFPGCEITKSEREYIANDVLVLKEAIEIMFNNGHKRLTIGSCCLNEYKTIFSPYRVEYNEYFPNLYDIWIDEKVYGVNNAGRYIWRAYHGGWCYVVSGKENQIKNNGVTLDVNSLYPFQMHSSSGNRYPVRTPHFWHVNLIPTEALKNDRFYYVRIKTHFYIREGYLPFIQIKGSMYYKGTESLTTSDRIDKETGKTTAYVLGADGEIHDTRVTMTLTMTDYELIKKHYYLVNCEILDGCWFETKTGIFDNYIDKYNEIKMSSTGAKRTLAKLFLNNLYGKMAASVISSFKVAYIKEDGVIGFYPITEDKAEPGYIAIGAAITSYARCYTITAAQANYYGPNKPGFIYADTDSIHCDLPLEKIKGVEIDNYKLGAWKPESYWDSAIFVRQKTYIEHITHENQKELEMPRHVIKCAGMPDNCKKIFQYGLDGYVPEDTKILKKNLEFLFNEDGTVKHRTLKDFKRGLKIYGKLRPKTIKGGVLLVNTTYEMK